MKAFPERVDSRLREFLAMEYHRRKRHDEAMALIWAGFTESPCLERYQNLKTHADRNHAWPTWREKALASLRGSIAGDKGVNSRSRWIWRHREDHSELVRVFLWEKDVEAAWHEAQQGGCSNDLWMELAAKLEKDHPEDVLPIYLAQIEPTLAILFLPDILVGLPVHANALVSISFSTSMRVSCGRRGKRLNLLIRRKE